NLYVIGASSPTDRSAFTGGNTGVFVMDTGVVVVDTKLAGYGPSLLERIKKVTDKPITMIINTHTHGDHTGSNEGFPTTVDIVAHENTKANMAKMDAFKGDKEKFLPKKTYKDTLSVGSGKDRVDLYYFGAGHSPVTTPKDLQEYQQFMAEWIAAVQTAAKAGKSADEAAASIDLTAKYPGYKKERYRAAIGSVYNELGK